MTDLFVHSTEIVARLTSQVTSATVYYGSQIVGANSQAAVMPALIVAPGPAEPVDPSLPEAAGFGIERSTWRVGVRSAVNTGAATTATMAEHVIGTLVHAVIKALAGYRFTTGTPSRLRYAGRDEMQYEVQAGYAEVWINFSADTAIS